MINWIIIYFQAFGSVLKIFFELFPLTTILLVNLPLILIFRGMYMVTHYLYYTQQFKGDLKEGDVLFTRKETIYFLLKNSVIIILGTLTIYAGLFFASYSLLLVGQYCKNIKEHSRKKLIVRTGKLIHFFGPLGFIGYAIITDIFTIIPIVLGLFIFMNYGQRNANLSLSELFNKYKNRMFLKRNKYLRYIILGWFISIPLVPLIGIPVCYPQKTTYMVEMGDGVKLSTDVYICPITSQPAPVVLIRTPYDKSITIMEIYVELYTSQGYNVVFQDLRGTFASEKENYLVIFLLEYLDGVDTIEWILNQSWSNGKVASIGGSALCLNQFFYAGMNPPGLVAQSLMLGTADLYSLIFQGGAFKEYAATNWIRSVAPSNYEDQLELMVTHSKRGPIYNSTSLFMEDGPNFANVNVMGMHTGGWFDLFTQASIDSYTNYDKNGGANALGKQLLIMGPWTHGGIVTEQQGQLRFPNSIGLGLFIDWEQKLLDHAVFGAPFDWENTPNVAYYMMGDVDDPTVDANEWRFITDWPPLHKDEKWYFSSDASMSSESKSPTTKAFTYLYNPRDPVPTKGGANLMLAAGPYDQRSIESRDDVILFETPVLTEPIDVIGKIDAHLFVSSNCTNTDFTVKLTDVYPDGRSMLITDGILNAIRRNGMDQDAPPLSSEGIVEIEVDLWSTAYQFNVGHKIRVSISSSNYPRFAANPNTGADQEVFSDDYLQYNVAQNSVWVGLRYPSYIVLPRPI